MIQMLQNLQETGANCEHNRLKKSTVVFLSMPAPKATKNAGNKSGHPDKSANNFKS